MEENKLPTKYEFGRFNGDRTTLVTDTDGFIYVIYRDGLNAGGACIPQSVAIHGQELIDGAKSLLGADLFQSIVEAAPAQARAKAKAYDVSVDVIIAYTLLQAKV